MSDYQWISTMKGKPLGWDRGESDPETFFCAQRKRQGVFEAQIIYCTLGYFRDILGMTMKIQKQYIDWRFSAIFRHKYVPELKLFVPWKSPMLPLSHWRMISETTKQTHQPITKQLKGDTTSSSQPTFTKGTLRRPWLRRCEVNPGAWPSLDTLQTMSWSVKWWLFENQLCLQLIVVCFANERSHTIQVWREKEELTHQSTQLGCIFGQLYMHAK